MPYRTSAKKAEEPMAEDKKTLESKKHERVGLAYMVSSLLFVLGIGMLHDITGPKMVGTFWGGAVACGILTIVFFVSGCIRLSESSTAFQLETKWRTWEEEKKIAEEKHEQEKAHSIK